MLKQSLFLWAFLSIPASAGVEVVTHHLMDDPANELLEFGDPSKAARILGNHFGPQAVLVVFDIDDTLLRGVGWNGSPWIGSGFWSRWQGSLPPGDLARVGETRRDQILRGRCLHLATRMEPVDPGTPSFMNYLRAHGFPIRVLTTRAQTEFLANETRSDLSQWYSPGAEFPEPVIYVGNGDPDSPAAEDKGAVIRGLLAAEPAFQAVIFIDDDEKNIRDVNRAMSAPGAEAYETKIFYFRGIDHFAPQFESYLQSGGAERMRLDYSFFHREIGQYCDGLNFRPPAQ